MTTYYKDPMQPENAPIAKEAAPLEIIDHDRSTLRKITFAGVYLFCCVFFFRPQDLIPGLAAVPIAKIIGIGTVLTLITGLASRAIRFTREISYLTIFFIFQCICIPFSIWKGGSFELVVLGLSKFILISIAAIGVLTTVGRLRKLLLIQTLAILLLTTISLTHYKEGRMFGVGSMFSDPNELALNLCVILPICIAMMVSSRKIIGSVFWMGAVALALLGIISTFSRGGFIALIVVGIALPWRFRFSFKALMALVVVAAAMLAGSVAYVGPTSYLERIKTISNPDADTSGAAADRQELLRKSIETSFHHPVFGVGPGNFQEVSGSWHQSHNTYTQLTSETGFPALFLFLTLMWITLKNLGSAKRLQDRDQFWFLAAAVQCGTLGYLAGAIFLSTTYWLLPYLLVAYGASIARMTQNKMNKHAESQETDILQPALRSFSY
jgi:hypothetical protein